MSVSAASVGSVANTRFIPAAQRLVIVREDDPSQRAILQSPAGRSAVILGAPGTGKTSTLIEFVAHRGQTLSAEEIIVLTPGRQAANRLRDVLASRLQMATNGALARTPMSLAFALASEKASLDAIEPPRLLTGAEQDQIFSELIDGHIQEKTGPDWPEGLSAEVRSSRVFRTELRELFSRCVDTLGSATLHDHETSQSLPQRLRQLGLLRGRPEWVAAGYFWDSYLDVVAESKAHYFDSSELMAIAATALADPLTMSQTRLVVVDDAQELTFGAANMLRAFASRGTAVVMFGDPDVASTTFRGAVPNLLGRADSYLGVPVDTYVLDRVHRHGAAIRRAVSTVTDRIGTASAGTQRRATASTLANFSTAPTVADPTVADPHVLEEKRPAVTLIERTSRSSEWAAVARTLREHHIFGGIPFSSMAVVVRNGGLVTHVARALAVNEVPSRTLVSDRSLRDQPIVRALISVVDVALGRASITVAMANDVLQSDLGGLTVLDLRRLRLALRHEDLRAGGNRTGEELLPEAIAGPGRLVTIDSRPARRAARFAAVLDEVRVLGASGASIEELLWCVWEGSRLSETWANDALGSGIVADEANRNLDSVMALFTSAKRFVEREPNRPAADFISELLAADIPEDTLAPQAMNSAVLVCTPTAVVGAEYDVVVVASLQEGSWPNLRLRGSLLHPQDIVEAHIDASIDAGIDGVRSAVDARKEVVEDELRMFALAISRARSHLVVSATRDDDVQPSPFFRLLRSVGTSLTTVRESGPASEAETEAGGSRSEWVHDEAMGRETPLSLRGIVGALRRSAASRHKTEVNAEVNAEVNYDLSDAVSQALALLAHADVPGANPNEWYGLKGPSTAAPLVDFEHEEGELVRVSPSKLEAWEMNQLGWFIASTVGSQSSAAMGVGSLFHSVIEAVGDDTITSLTPEDLWQPLEERWHELSFEAPWESLRERRRAFKMMGALSSYLTEFRDSGAEVVAVECEFTVEVGHAQLHGFIDRIEKDRDGNIVIVDLKTGALPSGTHAEENAQLLCYQFALANDGIKKVAPGSTSGGARLLYLRGKQKSAAAQTAEEVGREQPFTYKTLNQSALTHERDDDGNDPVSAMAHRIEEAAIGMAGGTFTAVVYTREERGEYDSRYENRIHVIKAVSA